MKYKLKILLLVIIWSTSYSAQNHSSKPYDMRDDSQIVKQGESNDFTIWGSLSERVITTSVVVGEIIILVFVVFYWKKTRNDRKHSVSNIYKNNIRAIRDERVIPIRNTKNSIKRRSLNNKMEINSLNSKTINIAAKKLAIAKGELFLAARIQQLQNQVR